MRLAVLTWNLKGSEAVDTAGVAAHAAAVGADVLVLQEVQWHQARRLAAPPREPAPAAGRSSTGRCARGPAGMAVIGVTLPVRARGRALTRRWRRGAGGAGSWWSAPSPAGSSSSTCTSAPGRPRRRAEVGLRGCGGSPPAGPAVVAGDLNEAAR